MEILDDESKFMEQLAQREQFLQNFYDSFASAKHLLNQLKPANNSNSDHNSDKNSSISSKNCNSPAVKLPDIKLPTFRLLEGSASQIIQSLEISAGTYKVAWDLLCKRYDNKKALIYNHLDALFGLEKIVKVSSFKLRNLSDTVSKHLRALNSLKLPTDQWDILILHLMAKTLDDGSVSKWEEYKSKKDLPSLEDMYEFFKSRSDLLERLELNKLEQGSKSGKTRGLLSADSENNSHENKTSFQGFKCAICSGDHRVFMCDKFKAMSVLNRMEQAKRLKLCLNCLRSGHKTNQCRLYASCKTSNQNINQENVSLTTSSVHFQILLSTVVVDVLNSYGAYVPVRAILDSVSMSSFITESLHSKLNIPKQTINFAVSGLNSAFSNVKYKCCLKFKSQHKNFTTDLSCFILPEITGNLTTFYIDKQKLLIPKYINLADKNFNKPGPIEMLIGADIFWNVLRPNQLKLNTNGPVLQETQLGWLVSGKIQGFQISNNIVCNLVKNKGDLYIQDQLSKFFEIESVKTASPWSKEEMDCETHFKDTTTRTQEGRFVVSIPLKASPKILGESLGLAKRRFKSLEQKFSKEYQFSRMYKNFILEYERLNHMQNIGEVSEVNHEDAYYLPHHGILRMHSATTKLRTVFDASARSTSGVSFNELQLKGPVIQDDLVSILLRFRQYKYVVTADIEKMYRQVLVSKDQHKMQRILWRDNENKALSVCELSTVTYGTTSAPFLAIRCLVELGKLADSSEGLVIGEDDVAKTLGISWMSKTDKLIFHIDVEMKGECLTKRVMLSGISRIFDPMGLLGPCIVIAKVMLQQLWKENLSWDSPVSHELQVKWNNFIQELPSLNYLKIQRHVICDNSTQIELHAFSDASEVAYGAAVYVRSKNCYGETFCHLLISKAKVAPIKSLTIPRVELCAAHLLAKLVNKVTTSLRLDFNSVTLWSDSTIVLGWIKTPVHLLKPFVRNRIAEIQDLTDISSWRYVPSLENPADILSRGSYPSSLNNSNIWWQGPYWLQESPDL
ncbi:uncharacterized protein LOC130894179 [Diorhabda carinulata]|uniref:uncharacterized protein LOC130894179 n=1 Tax=Diorhabda carinulata TaxID=1163345 RepID=UPI0025A28C08|nr:uncharacterized protein LOC130894179 [Diorhabda carinulata]